jgi:hypothetical protein
VARAERSAGAHRFDLDQHGATSAPVTGALLRFGQSIGRAIESYDTDLDVLVLGTGGLSH